MGRQAKHAAQNRARWKDIAVALCPTGDKEDLVSTEWQRFQPSRFDVSPPALPIFIRFSQFIMKVWKQGKKLLTLRSECLILKRWIDKSKEKTKDICDKNKDLIEYHKNDVKMQEMPLEWN